MPPGTIPSQNEIISRPKRKLLVLVLTSFSGSSMVMTVDCVDPSKKYKIPQKVGEYVNLYNGAKLLLASEPSSWTVKASEKDSSSGKPELEK